MAESYKVILKNTKDDIRREYHIHYCEDTTEAMIRAAYQWKITFGDLFTEVELIEEINPC